MKEISLSTALAILSGRLTQLTVTKEMYARWGYGENPDWDIVIADAEHRIYREFESHREVIQSLRKRVSELEKMIDRVEYQINS